MSATFAASLVISPALGSILSELYGPTAVYLLSSIIAVADVLFIIFFVPEVCGQKRFDMILSCHCHFVLLMFSWIAVDE